MNHLFRWSMLVAVLCVPCACDGAGPIPDGGAIACGSEVCDGRDHYCEERTSSSMGDRYECRPLPSSCGDMPTCACADGEPCGSSCSSNNGLITLSCSE